MCLTPHSARCARVQEGRPVGVIMSVQHYERLRGTAWERLTATMDALGGEASANGLTRLGSKRFWWMKADRVVADTNVLISAALLPDGRPRAVIDAVRSANGVLLFSDETFVELRSRIDRRKFDRYVGRDARAAWLGPARSGLGTGFDNRREVWLSRPG